MNGDYFGLSLRPMTTGLGLERCGLGREFGLRTVSTARTVSAYVFQCNKFQERTELITFNVSGFGPGTNKKLS